MNEQQTLENWISALEKEIKSSSLLDFSFNNTDSFRIMKDDFISLFNDVSQGKSYKLCLLDDFTSIDQAISSYRQNHVLEGNELFSNISKENEKNILSFLYEKQNKELKETSSASVYLGFGLIRYALETFSESYQYAPLLFIPVRINYSSETDTYSIQGIKGEVFPNKLLFDRIKKVRRVDLSYPIGPDFSISDYLYYISIKAQPLNWNVSNYVFISSFDLTKYEDFLEIKAEKDKIVSHSIVKKISYFNSQFFAFNKTANKQLDSRYLSVLELENDEYNILRHVALRENLFIRADNEESKIHLTSNIILSHLMNNMKVLVVYSDKEEKEKLHEYILNQGYENYCADLDPSEISKEDLLADVVDYDKHLIPYGKAKPDIVNNDIQKYYDYKNKYKKLFNSLRTVSNPLHISINRLINEYYKLDNYPLLNITIKDANRLNSDDISHYMEIIDAFTKNIVSLGCPIEEHPFYGFNKKTMYKADYENMKKLSIELTILLNDVNTLLHISTTKYAYPIPHNLKEIKALLNILAFIDEYKNDASWIDDKFLPVHIEELKVLRNDIIAMEAVKNELQDKYTRKVFFLKKELIDDYLSSNSSKTKVKLKKLLGKKISPEEFELLISDLKKLYDENDRISERLKGYDGAMVQLMKEGRISELEKTYNQIRLFKASLKYIKDKNNFDIKNILNDKTRNRLVERKAIQNAYNQLLEKTNLMQSYFSKDIIHYESLNLNEYVNKMDKISKNFIMINDYTDFFKSLEETNDFIDHLGSELINQGNPDDFKKMFLKRFYYDLINERITSNPILKENTRDSLYHDLNAFSSSDETRKKMTTDIISGYIDSYLKLNLLNLRKNESDKIYHLFSKGMKITSMNMITSEVKSSLFHLKPCIMVSYKNISRYLQDSIYQFDNVIFLARKNISVLDSLPALAHSSNAIVFDEDFVSTDPRNTLSANDNTPLDNSLIMNAKNSYHIYSFKSDNKNIILQNSRSDAAIKNHVAKLLLKHGMEVKTDYPFKSYTIDLVVRIPGTRNMTAVEFSHLPYNSPEDTYRSFEKEDELLKSSSFTPYRIVTSSYFYNESMENTALIDFIVKTSNIIPQDKIKKNIIPLMDYLFKEYKDPHLVYYELDESISLKDRLWKVIDECAPVSLKELTLLFKENISPLIRKLKKNNLINIEDGFIEIPGRSSEFRRVNRNEEYYRPINYISRKEIYDAVYRVTNYLKNVECDTVIKMILLSLGYKKMNQENYDFVGSCIEFLLEKNIIFMDETRMLFTDLLDHEESNEKESN